MRDTGRAGYPEWTPERFASLAKAVAVVLAGGIFLGAFVAKVNLYYVAAAIGATVLVGLVAWQFEAVLALYVLTGWIAWGQTPSLAVGGSGAGKGILAPEMLLGLLIAIWGGKCLLGWCEKRWVRNGFTVPIICYLVYCVFNVANSYVFWDPNVGRQYQYAAVNVIELGLRLMSAGAFVLMATSISSRKWLVWITVAMLVPGLYNLVISTARMHGPVAQWWPLIALLPACYLWAVVLDSGRRVWVRSLAAAMVGVAIFVILIQGIGWVSGWVGLGVGLATVTLIRNRKVFAAGCVLVAVAVVVFMPFLHQNVVSASREEGDYDRFGLMAGAWRYATTFPLGVGMGNYRSYNTFYYGEKWGTTAYTSAHGTYSQHLSEMGVPGLLLFLAILFYGGRWLLRSYRSIRDPFSRVYVLAALGQLVGISVAAAIGDYIVPTYHNGGLVNFPTTVYCWLCWGLAVAHVKVTNGSAEHEHENAELPDAPTPVLV